MSGGFLSNRDIIAANIHFPYSIYEYSDGLIVYSGHHYVHGSALTHPKWICKKYTYDASSFLIRLEILEGQYSDKENLSWVS